MTPVYRYRMPNAVRVIAPALTPEEWARVPVAQGGAVVTLDFGDGDFRDITRGHHRIAALCLHGQPFGFRPDMLQALSRVIDDAERWTAQNGWTGNYSSDAERRLAREARDLIAALLPSPAAPAPAAHGSTSTSTSNPE